MKAQKKALPGAGTPDRATNTAGRADGSTDILSQAGSEGKTLFVGSSEVMELLGVSRSTACRCIQQVNQQAKARGLFVVRGLCNRRLFMEFVGYEDVD